MNRSPEFFSTSLENVFNQNINKLLLPLNSTAWGIRFEYSAGLGMLILAKETAEKGDLDLVLRSPKGHVKSLLELGHFDKLFTIQA